jgi:hypothetical protein
MSPRARIRAISARRSLELIMSGFNGFMINRRVTIEDDHARAWRKPKSTRQRSRAAKKAAERKCWSVSAAT